MRASGVLMHISSLPSPYGIGTMGEEARQFIRFLHNSGCKYWQVLPMGPTSYGDSPYQSFSSMAGNPYFIDLSTLIEDGFLKEEECAVLKNDSNEVDYELLYDKRFDVLKIATERFAQKPLDAFEEFCLKQKDWIEDYALFMALKDASDGDAWYLWREGLKTRNPESIRAAQQLYSSDILFYKILQFWFYQQYEQLKKYAHINGVELIGDIPIYVAYDSVEVWCEPKLFLLDDKLHLKHVAGCPPDAFDENGQLWGNPIYDWNLMKEDDYVWWARRLGHALHMYDKLRIDHFRGFASYYSIDASAKDAKGGHWIKGPGMDFFQKMEIKYGKMPIIAEDLGFITDDVRALLTATGYPGMKILQFAFDKEDGKNEYLPHNYHRNCVVYPGTHDNNTICGWMKECPKDALYAINYWGINKKEGFAWGMIRGALSSVADLAIIPMQDILEVASEGRMNRPSTVGGNWTWRMNSDAPNRQLIERLKEMNDRYARTTSEDEA